MPKILDRLVGQLKDKGYSESSAFAIGTSALQKSGNLKPGTRAATPKGIKQGDKTPELRAKERAVKYGGGKTSDYTYNAAKNTTKRKRGL